MGCPGGCGEPVVLSVTASAVIIPESQRFNINQVPPTRLGPAEPPQAPSPPITEDEGSE